MGFKKIISAPPPLAGQAVLGGIGYLRKRIPALAALACVGFLFFILYSYLPFSMQEGALMRLNSPDETANYHFTKLFANKSELGFPDPILSESNNFVHPRSMTVVLDTVRPVSFLGMVVVYGALAKMFGVAMVPFFTPLLAVVAAGFFYLLVRKLFGHTTAVIAAILLLIHPGYWYYASRSMMPNVLFVDLCIIGFSLLIVSRHWIAWALGGFLLSLSLTIRFSEVLWLMPLIVVSGLVFFRQMSISRVGAAAIGFAIPLTAFFLLNNAVYGDPLSFGYQTVDTGDAIRSLEHSRDILKGGIEGSVREILLDVQQALAAIIPYILPFGFTPATFFANFQNYGLWLFPWLVPPAILGVLFTIRDSLIVLFREKRLDARLYFLLATIGVGAWLVIFYGSWLFHDNIAKEITIGNSYVRYWLPFSIMALPFAAAGFSYFINHCPGKGMRNIVVVTIIGVFAIFSIQKVYWDSSDGLFQVADNIKRYRETALSIIQLTPSDAVIFSERSDKIFFPERRAAQVFNGFPEIPLLPRLSRAAPVYYYGFWTPADAAYVSKKYFSSIGMHLEYQAQLHDNEYLYRLASGSL